MVKINKPALEKELEEKKKLPWYTKIIILLTILLFGIIAAFFGYYSYTNKNLQAAQTLQEQVEKLETEKARCNQVISQGQGAFSEYEYCTKLLNTFK